MNVIERFNLISFFRKVAVILILGISLFSFQNCTRAIFHGSTDEIGFHAVDNRHYVTDIHATILRQMGLDSRRLEIPGRKRLEIDHGVPIDEIIA